MAINDIPDGQFSAVEIGRKIQPQCTLEDLGQELLGKSTLETVETLIDKMPYYGMLKEENYSLVKEARRLYNSLTDYEKAKLDKGLLEKLLNNETTIYFRNFEKEILEGSKTDLDENDFNFISSLPLDYYDEFLSIIAGKKKDFDIFKIGLGEKELHKNTIINKLLDYAAEQQQEKYIKILEIELGKHQEILHKQETLINILRKSQFNNDDFGFLYTLKREKDILNIIYLILKNKYAALSRKYHYVFLEGFDENLRRQYEEENEKLKPDMLELDKVLRFVYFGLLGNKGNIISN